MRQLFSTLHFRLVSLVLLALVPSFALTLYTGLEARQTAADAARSDALQVALLASADQDLLIESTRQLLAGLARLPEVRQGDPATCSAFFADLLKQYPLYANLLVTKANGDLWCSATPFSGTVNYTDRAWFQEALRTRDFAVGGYVMGKVTRKPLASFAYPILGESGQVQAVIAAGIDLAWLNRFVAQAQLPPGSVLTVTDNQGTVLARSLDPDRWIGQTVSEAPVVKTILARQCQGTVEATGVDGVDRLYAFTSLGSAPPTRNLCVHVGIPTAIAYAPADQIMTRNLLALGIVAALAIAAARYFGDRLIVREMDALVGVTRRIAAGDLSARTGGVHRAGEIAELARAFDQMADSLEQREEERKRAVEMLRTSEERFRALIEKAADVSALLTVEGTFTYVSPSVERVMGYTPDQVIGKSIAEWIHPEDLSQAMHALAERVQMGCGAPNPMHARVRHRDGRWRVLEAIGNNLLDLPAVRGIVLNCRDVTERIQAQHQVQQQLERLAALREVDRAITSSVDLRLTLDVVTQQVTAQLKVDAVSILLLDPHAHELKYAAGRGFRTKAIEQTRLRVGEEHAGRAALERRTVHIPNLPANVKQFLRGTLLTSENFIAYYGVPLIVKGQVNGVLEIFHRAPLDAEPEWLDFMEMLAGQAAVAIDNAGLFSGLQRANMDLTLAYEATIEGWSHALDLRDHETEGHTRRVTAMTLDLAQALGMSDERLIHVRHGALLHDIGKIGVPDAILLKPDALTDEEWQVMRLHPKIAYDLLASIAYLKPALDIPYCHHEKWDGSGYPRGLKGEQIPLAARVFAVVDAWDALTSNRPYRKAWSAGQAREYIAQNAGAHFDPRVAGMFLEMPIGGR